MRRIDVTLHGDMKYHEAPNTRRKLIDPHRSNSRTNEEYLKELDIDLNPKNRSIPCALLFLHHLCEATRCGVTWSKAVEV